MASHLVLVFELNSHSHEIGLLLNGQYFIKNRRGGEVSRSTFVVKACDILVFFTPFFIGGLIRVSSNGNNQRSTPMFHMVEVMFIEKSRVEYLFHALSTQWVR